MEFIKDMLKYVIIIVIIVLIRIYIIATAEVVGDSMEPNLHSGNMLVTEKVTTYAGTLSRFDVIAFKHSNPNYLIKRIIGLPGEKVNYSSGKLYINDKEVKEPFSIKGTTGDFSLSELKYDIIPKDMYFVMGDNRENSLDSRKIGLVSKKKILGRAMFVGWPIKEIKFVK